MAVLLPVEYDASYFDGVTQALAHNAGYSRYARWPSADAGRMTEGRASTGEYWRDKAVEMVHRFDLVGKSVLEIGCAKGFLVEDMVAEGVDAFGLDVSAWAINLCPGVDTDAAATDAALGSFLKK